MRKEILWRRVLAGRRRAGGRARPESLHEGRLWLGCLGYSWVVVCLVRRKAFGMAWLAWGDVLVLIPRCIIRRELCQYTARTGFNWRYLQHLSVRFGDWILQFYGKLAKLQRYHSIDSGRSSWQLAKPRSPAGGGPGEALRQLDSIRPMRQLESIVSRALDSGVRIIGAAAVRTRERIRF